MTVLLAAICGTLIVLAFSQVILETILPEGSTKRFVAFIVGLTALAVIVSMLTMSGQDIMKTIYSKTEEMQRVAQDKKTKDSDGYALNPYKEYIEKLIDSYK